MPIKLPSEKGDFLDLAEAEACWALFRAPVPVTIATDVLTVAGSGRYRVSAQTGTTDQVTSIVTSQENIDGCLICLQAAAGHLITLVNAGSLHLGLANLEINGPRTSAWLRNEGGNIWHLAMPLVYVP